jgi:hypothetical protein
MVSCSRSGIRSEEGAGKLVLTDGSNEAVEQVMQS